MSAHTTAFIYTDDCDVQVNFRWVNNVLWTFIGKHISDVMYTNRSIMTGGAENGIELWRAYYTKHEGGADQVELGGIGSLHSFPQCDKAENLQHWIGKWVEVKDLYGAGVSDLHLKSMFINILPENVKKEVREHKHLHSLQDCINHVMMDLGRINDAKLSKLHADRLKQSLSSSQRVNAVTEHEDEAGAHPKANNQFQSIINQLSTKIDTIAAAVNTKRTEPRGGARVQAQRQGQRGTFDFAKFKGCLHGGNENHRVSDFRAKKALLDKNDGKLPAGFKSAFDKWKASQPKKVAALTESELLDDENDSDGETEPIWNISCSAISTKPRSPCCYNHPNLFSELFDDNNYNDDEDDDEHMLRAIKELTPHVSIGAKVSQRKRATGGQLKPIDRRTIASIAKSVRDGLYNLPDVRLDSNSEYEAVWALVDSAAGRSCAKRREHFAHTHTELKASTVRMATASGEELKTKGCFTLDVMSAEGHVLTQTFEDTNVDMPTMSVTELASNGQLGSDVVFRKHDGAVVDVETGATSRLVRRKGVYFMKVYTPRNNKSGFTRPGAA